MDGTVLHHKYRSPVKLRALDPTNRAVAFSGPTQATPTNIYSSAGQAENRASPKIPTRKRRDYNSAYFASPNPTLNLPPIFEGEYDENEDPTQLSLEEINALDSDAEIGNPHFREGPEDHNDWSSNIVSTPTNTTKPPTPPNASIHFRDTEAPHDPLQGHLRSSLTLK